MASSGAPSVATDGSGLRVAVIAAAWHEEVATGLLEGCTREAARLGCETEVFRVPGSFELAVAALKAAEAGFDAVVALGVIIRGGTPHFEYVSAGVTHGLTDVAVRTGVPVGFGVLTCDTTEQAIDRAGLPGSSEDKGAEALSAAVETAVVLRSIGGSRRSYTGFGPA